MESLKRGAHGIPAAKLWRFKASNDVLQSSSHHKVLLLQTELLPFKKLTHAYTKNLIHIKDIHTESFTNSEIFHFVIFSDKLTKHCVFWLYSSVAVWTIAIYTSASWYKQTVAQDSILQFHTSSLHYTYLWYCCTR